MLDQSFHSMMSKKVYSYDCKLREYLIGLINNNASSAETNKSFYDDYSSTNIFDEIERKWKSIMSGAFMLQVAPILLQGSSIEGCSLARLANPTLKTVFEFEMDLNIIIGTVNQKQFKTCYKPLDENKAFFHYVIENSLDDDISICINLPDYIERKLVSSISGSLNSVKSKCLSGMVLKEFLYNKQPTTNNPLKAISVRGVEGIFSETFKKKIEGCSALLKFSTENLSKEDTIMNLKELVKLAKQQLNRLNKMFEEFNDLDCETTQILIKCLNEVRRLKSILMKSNGFKKYINIDPIDPIDHNVIDYEISIKENNNFCNYRSEPFLMINQVWNAVSPEKESILECRVQLKSHFSKISDVVDKWIQSFAALRESNNDLYQFCFNMNALLPDLFNTNTISIPTLNSILYPDFYYSTYFDSFISDWNKDKSNPEEIIKMATIICKQTKEMGLTNLIILKKQFSEFIEPNLNVAIGLIEESLFLTNKYYVSTEILIDNIPCFYAPFWPEAGSSWVKRKRFWPDSHLVGSIERNGFHIVPKSLPEGDENSEWRLSFSAAESVLSLHRTEKQNYIYFLFKSLFYRYVKTYTHEKSLSTYICKTVMMWTCEQQPVSWWDETTPENGVLLLIRELIKGIQKKVIKHYFIEELNLLEHFSSSILILTELTLFDLENNFSENLENLLETMSTKINFVYENLLRKQTHPLDFSVAFIYKQESLSKINFVVQSLVKMFWYYFFSRTYSIYEEISRTKSEIIFQAQFVDLIAKDLKLQENEEVALLRFVENKKLAGLIDKVTSLDKAKEV